MAEGLDLDSCDVRVGVLSALFDPNFTTLRKPFKDHVIPGMINAVDYDLGNQGFAYRDTDIMATTGAPGGGNNGNRYRNDGVDIEASTDPQGAGFNVGWMETGEWLKYTVHVETTGVYDVDIRVASDVGGGVFALQIDDVQIGDNLSVVNTGGWQNWITVRLNDVLLSAGEHTLKLTVRTGGLNVNRMHFTLGMATPNEDIQEAPVRARLSGSYPNPFADEVRVMFTVDRPVRARVEVFDLLGRRVFVRPGRTFSGGEHTLVLRPELAPGSYVLRLHVDDGRHPQSLFRSIVVSL